MTGRGSIPCRCCGRVILETIAYDEVRVITPEGFHTERVPRLSGKYGYKGSQICTLRCGFAWANRKAPK